MRRKASYAFALAALSVGALTCPVANAATPSVTSIFPVAPIQIGAQSAEIGFDVGNAPDQLVVTVTGSSPASGAFAGLGPLVVARDMAGAYSFHFLALSATDLLYLDLVTKGNAQNIIQRYDFAIGLIDDDPSTPMSVSTTGNPSWSYRADFGVADTVNICVLGDKDTGGPIGQRLPPEQLKKLGCQQAPTTRLAPLWLAPLDDAGTPVSVTPGSYLVCVSYPKGVPGCQVTRDCELMPIGTASLVAFTPGSITLTESDPSDLGIARK